MNPEIPILAIPILNRGDLLVRLFNSIDHPVAKFVIINNGTNPTVRRAIDIILKQRANVEVVSPGHNLGVAASWNKVMKDYPAPYWFIASNDIQFKPGDLQKMVETYYLAENPMVVCGNHGMAFFIVTRKCFNVIGTFDENFIPGYVEDVDYLRRLSLSGYGLTDTPGITAIHGEPGTTTGSSTIGSNPDYNKMNGVTFPMNLEYYRKKWGGFPAEEKFARPFNIPDYPLSKWELDLDRFKQMQIW